MKALFCFLLIQMAAVSLAAEDVAREGELALGAGKDGFELKAKAVPLGDIISELKTKFNVEITGLDTRKEERVTFSSGGESLEVVLKRLFRRLEEDNYAFEYSSVSLTRVSVLPKGKSVAERDPAVRPKIAPPSEENTSVVSVVSVVENSQAEELGIEQDDLIIRYDGLKIAGTSHLIREVKARSKKESVEMLVIRDGEPLSFTLKGGLIGVRIQAKRIPKEELDSYYR